MEVSKIKLARQRAGLTQKKVYELLGIPIRTLQDWESLKNKQPLWQEKLVIEKLNSIAKEKGLIIYYYIDYQMQGGNEWVYGTLEDAIKSAKDGAYYSQQSIKIFSSDEKYEEGSEELYLLCEQTPVAEWHWWDVPTEEDGENIIVFANGHYELIIY